MLVLCLPSRGANPYDGDEQDDGRDPHKDPFESMEHRSCHRVFRIGEIPFEIRAANRRQCDKDKCRDGGDRDAKGVQRTALEFLCPCELVGYRTKSVSDIGPSAQAGGLFPWV